MAGAAGGGVHFLDELRQREAKAAARGMYSICSAHPRVLEAGIQQAMADQSALLIESTCNQVNQTGGYTGLTPSQFVEGLNRMLDRTGFAREMLILGGDHLGPNPWRNLPAETAMEHAKELVSAYIRAGFEKIHLDASMSLMDDPPGPLSPFTASERAAELCVVSEASRQDGQEGPYYVIGTEVPPPGGMSASTEEISITSIDQLEETFEHTRQAFLKRNLGSAWERVVAVVVQPGVEFGHDFVHAYNRDRAAPLTRWIRDRSGLVFEAHSTDFQTEKHLTELVQDHFAILKVGPELTFAYREAVFALSKVEEELARMNPDLEPSKIISVMEKLMHQDPTHWREYYRVTGEELRSALLHSRSDRIRYYWSQPEAQDAMRTLEENLVKYHVPASILIRFFPSPSTQEFRGEDILDPNDLILHVIRVVLGKYARATHMSNQQDHGST